MFGQEYLITAEFPEYFLDYREKLNPDIRWTDRVQSQSGDWSGNVFDFFRTVYPKVTADFKKPFMTDGVVRVEESPRHLAVREAIANCLVNTDFFQSWSVVIEKYPDRIELANPGVIRVGKEQMLLGGISEPRNKNLLKMFNQIGIGEHAGSGVPEVFSTWKSEGLKEPEVKEQFGPDKPDRTIVILPLESGTVTDRATDKVTDNSAEARREQILHIMDAGVEYKAEEIAEKLGLKSTRTKALLRELLELDKVEAIGNTRGRRYKKKC